MSTQTTSSKETVVIIKPDMNSVYKFPCTKLFYGLQKFWSLQLFKMFPFHSTFTLTHIYTPHTYIRHIYTHTRAKIHTEKGDNASKNVINARMVAITIWFYCNRSDQKCSTGAICGIELPSPHLPDFIDF